MEDLPADLRAALVSQPFFELTDNKKIKCTLNGHELPCNLTELQKFTEGKKYKKLSSRAEFNYSQYEPHIIPSTKQPNQLFCKLTLRHLNRDPHHVLIHVNGKRFKKALAQYEECVKQGIEFVPERLKNKRPKEKDEDFSRGMSSKHSSSVWEPSCSDDEDHSDSEDSMSDLYPSSMFTLKNPVEENMEEEGEEDDEDEFQTDEEMEEKVVQKRKKVQSGGFQKKFRNNRWKSGRKKQQKVQNGK
ncbi:surfeit locus protein 2 [Oryzias melastigma]|uniref:Surfeit 2 n=1 Tax=Oryzias melastigma TaxID=30732 RepID=A0A3B3D3A3_ORYME|nr:surfeit locus protein 2 [Oryzias melastigma]